MGLGQGTYIHRPSHGNGETDELHRLELVRIAPQSIYGCHLDFQICGSWKSKENFCSPSGLSPWFSAPSCCTLWSLSWIQDTWRGMEKRRCVEHGLAGCWGGVLGVQRKGLTVPGVQVEQVGFGSHARPWVPQLWKWGTNGSLNFWASCKLFKFNHYISNIDQICWTGLSLMSKYLQS